MKILIIDDTYSDYINSKEIINSILGHVNIIYKNNAEDGIKEALSNDYDLVFCDVVMPGKWGYDACREIHRLKPNLDIYILTGSLEGLDSTLAREAGALDLICKGVDFKHLKEVLIKNKKKYTK